MSDRFEIQRQGIGFSWVTVATRPTEKAARLVMGRCFRLDGTAITYRLWDTEKGMGFAYVRPGA